MSNGIWRESDQKLFILNRRSYRESSLLIDAFSEQHGKLALVAKGGRGPKSKTAGVLQPFVPLRASWQGRTELLTLTSVEREPGEAKPLTGKRLYCGFYLNELLTHLLHRHDPHPHLFASYQSTLAQLAQESESMDGALRRFELVLLRGIGYGPVLDRDVASELAIDPQQSYLYRPDSGPVLSSQPVPGCAWVRGQALLNLRDGLPGTREERQDAKRLMRCLIDYHLNGKLLKSRELFG